MKTLWKTVFSSAFQKSYICETVGEKRICYNVRNKAGVCMDVKLRSYTDLRKGLIAEEAAARREKGEYNEQLKKTTKSYRMIFRDNLMTLFNLINVILAALVFITGNYRNMLFLGVIISNIVIGIFQEIRSKRVLDRLSLLSQTHVKALRDGRECELALDEIVIDDLLFLSNGDQIPCDAIVREGRLECNESLVSGESDIILKEAGSFLYSGSFAVSGHVCAQVCAVGRQTYVHTILDHARQVRRHPSQLRDAINFIIKTVSIIIVPMGLLLMGKQLFFTHAALNDAIPATVAAVLGMIPEGLVLLTSVALAVGTINLARKNTLVQELYCIETLARVDTLCCDKTGTITAGCMTVEEVIPYADADIQEILGHCFHDLQDTNATAQAIRAYASPQEGWQSAKTLAFSSARKASGVTYEERGTYLIGAYEFIFVQRQEDVERRISDLAAQGKRVVALAASPDEIQDDLHDMDCTLLALIVLSDPIRPEAPEILDYFYDQGVDVKIISGDDARTVQQIAAAAGVRDADLCVDASALKEEEIEAAVERYTVFGRVSPVQKKQMIEALKRKGHITAMTGDGVNDVMALKEADCSIAMAQGSEAAKNIANLVLLDSNFSHLPDIVNEGRRVINNIQRTASLFLVKTSFSVILGFLTLFFIPIYPFEPIQLTLISTVSIGIPSFFLALEPNHERVRGNFLRNVFSKALPGALCVVLSVFYVYALTAIEPLSQEVISTLCVILAGCSSLAVLFRISRPFNMNRRIIFGAMCLMFVLCIIVPPLASWFMLVRLSPLQLLCAGVGIVLIPLVQNGLFYIFERLTFTRPDLP